MKNLYVPKGKTLHYETLSCQNLVVDGVLVVEETLSARSISGKGILDVGTISARHVAAMDIECASLIAESLAAERVCAAEVILSGPAVVSCYLEAEYVETPKLTVGKSKIGTLRAADVVNLPEKERGILGALAAGFLRRLWLSLTHRIPVDADYTPAATASESADAPQEEQSAAESEDTFSGEPSGQETVESSAPHDDLENDFEFKRLRAMYRLLRDYGYTLRIAKREEPEQIRPDAGSSASFQEAA